MRYREKILIGLGLAILLFLYVRGRSMMFFHQDDVDFLVVIARDWPKVLLLPVNEHVVILFWFLFRLEWILFGVNFAGFLSVSFFLHIVNLILAGKLVLEETKSKFLAVITGLVLTVNNNWNESIWWTTGQMWLLATMFCLISIFVMREIKKSKLERIELLIGLSVFSILPGLSWGVGLLWPSILMFYSSGRKKVIGVLVLSQAALVGVYEFISHPKNVGGLLEISKIFKMIMFIIIGVSNTVIGRLIFAWENKPIRFLILLCVLIAILYKSKLLIRKLFPFVIFMFVSVAALFFTYSLGRAWYGIGAPMAARYAYLPTFLLVIGVAVYISKFNWKKHQNIIFVGAIYLCISGLMAFNWRVGTWVERPGQTRRLFEKLALFKDRCIVDAKLPAFVNPQPTRNISELVYPLKINPRFGIEERGCVEITQ